MHLRKRGVRPSRRLRRVVRDVRHRHRSGDDLKGRQRGTDRSDEGGGVEAKVYGARQDGHGVDLKVRRESK